MIELPQCPDQGREVLMPAAVFDELQHLGRPPAVLGWARQLPPWIEVREVSPREAIHLAERERERWFRRTGSKYSVSFPDFPASSTHQFELNLFLSGIERNDTKRSDLSCFRRLLFRLGFGFAPLLPARGQHRRHCREIGFVAAFRRL